MGRGVTCGKTPPRARGRDLLGAECVPGGKNHVQKNGITKSLSENSFMNKHGREKISGLFRAEAETTP